MVFINKEESKKNYQNTKGGQANNIQNHVNSYFKQFSFGFHLINLLIMFVGIISQKCLRVQICNSRIIPDRN
jgi:hypothetical protein